MTTQMSLGIGAAAVVLVGSFIWGEQVVTRQAGKDRVTVIYWEKWTGDEGKGTDDPYNGIISFVARTCEGVRTSFVRDEWIQPRAVGFCW